MTTTVSFFPFLSDRNLPDVSAYAVVGAKGTLHLSKLATLTSIAPFSTLATSTTDPLHVPGNPPSSVTVWINSLSGPRPIVFSQFDNTLSRNMGVLRTDTLRDTVGSAVPSSGDAQLTLVVQSKQEAFAAALAAARNWPLYSKKTTKLPGNRTVHIDFVIANGDTVNYKEIQAVADAIRNTQRLFDTPCSELNTDAMVAEAKSVAESLNRQQSGSVAVEVIRGEQLRDRGFGGLWNVGKAAEFPPALVILSYTPAKDSGKTVILVGKGIVYDCGGLSLKATTSMCGMKGDMGGAGAVLGAFQALVTAKVSTANVHALLCLAENAIDAKSFKNDDVITHYSGKTSEINNTDAEGRLVLADGVAYASKHLKPDVIVDIATLTGAQLINTGKVHAGIVSRTEESEHSMITAGKATGDLCFPMLYAPELLMKNFKSEIADIKNSVSDRSNAQSSCAGHFVEYHLDDDYKGHWVHVDIAGPAEDSKARGTGFGVALLYQYVKSLE